MSKSIDLTRSQIVCDNSFRILKDIPSESVDAVVTDPPYASLADSIASDRRSSRTMYSSLKFSKFPNLAGVGISPVYFGRWLCRWMEECCRVLKPGGLFYCFMDWRGLAAVCEQAALAGFRQDGIFVWHKVNGRPQQGRHRNSCEYVFLGRKPGGGISDRAVCGKGFASTPIVPEKDRRHLTHKPDALMIELMSVIPSGAVVLDPFAGSGSTVVACERTGRVGIGIECVPEYAEIAKERLAEVCAAKG